ITLARILLPRVTLVAAIIVVAISVGDEVQLSPHRIPLAHQAAVDTAVAECVVETRTRIEQSAGRAFAVAHIPAPAVIVLKVIGRTAEVAGELLEVVPAAVAVATVAAVSAPAIAVIDIIVDTQLKLPAAML